MTFGSFARETCLVLLLMLQAANFAPAQQTAQQTAQQGAQQTAQHGAPNQTEQIVAVKKAVNRLRQIPQWQHLDDDWIDSVFNQTAHGPAVNIEVTVTSPDGKPVPGAVVAIQESYRDLLTRFVAQIWPAPAPRPIRAIAVTDPNGKCRFNATPMTPPGSVDGRIDSHVVVAHPIHGFDWRRIIRMSTPQSVDLTMAKQTSYQTLLSYRREAATAIHVRLNEVSKVSAGYDGLDPDYIFGPRAISDETGKALFSHLPQGGQCRLVAHSEDDVLQFYSEEPASIDSHTLGIPLSKSKQKAFRAKFIDSQTNEPIKGVRIEGWQASKREIFSDEQGKVSTRAYVREGRRCRITAVPPAGWTREVFLISQQHVGKDLIVPLTASTAVRGRVIDSDTGVGIAGVTLKSEKKNVQLASVNSSYEAIAETADDGSFVIALPLGEQEITVFGPVVGYQVPIKRNRLRVPEFLPHRIVVNAGEPMEELRFALIPAQPISGRVVDESGSGVAGANVFCHVAAPYGEFRDGLPLSVTVTSATTDQQGRFDVRPPAAENKQVRLKAKFQGRESQDSLFEIDPAVGVSNVELQLGGPARKYHIIGRVMKDEQPWAGVPVKVQSFESPSVFSGGYFRRPWNASVQGEANTDSEGHYRIEIHVNDVERVRVSVSGLGGSPIVYLDRPTVDLGALRYFEHKRGEQVIQGTVVDPSGSPVRGISVQATVADRNYIHLNGPKPEQRRSVTDQEGRFTIRELFVEPVEITVRAIGNAAAKYQPSSRVTITGGTHDARIVFDSSLGITRDRIEPDAVTTLQDVSDAQDGPANSIEGFVVNDQDQPIAGATVRVFCAQPNDKFPGNNPFSHTSCSIVTTTDIEGTFVIGPIAANSQVRLVAAAKNHHAMVGEFVSPTPDVEAVIIELPPVAEKTRGKTAMQILTDASGNPLPFSVVGTATRTDLDIQQFRSRAGSYSMTDIRGQFALPNQPSFVLSTLAAFPINRPVCHIHSRYPERGYSPVGIGNSITGHVVDEGKPVVGHIICLRSSGSALPGTIRVATDNDGRFRIDQVANDDEYLLFGDISQPNAKHLVTRRLAGGQSGKLIDLGALALEKTHELALKVVPAEGKDIPPMMTVRCRLMSGGPSISTVVSSLGVAVLEHVPREPVEIWIGRQVEIDGTIPPMQRLYNPGQYGIRLTDDQELLVQLK